MIYTIYKYRSISTMGVNRQSMIVDMLEQLECKKEER